jgi:hypothetical protein
VTQLSPGLYVPYLPLSIILHIEFQDFSFQGFVIVQAGRNPPVRVFHFDMDKRDQVSAKSKIAL